MNKGKGQGQPTRLNRRFASQRLV